MKQLAKEFYQPTRHYWYQVDLETDHEYGKIFNSDLDIRPIVETIKSDMGQELAEEGMYWYLGKELDQILLMIRYKEGSFNIQINLKDFDYALNLDKILDFKEKLEKELKA